MNITHRRAAGWLVIILLLALVLRLFALDRFPLWYDEWFSWMETRGYAWASLPIDGSFTKRTLDSHPGLPGVRYAVLGLDNGNALLYAASLKAWIGACGSSIAALRGFSVLMGACAVALAWVLCTQLRFNHRSRAIACLLVAASPFLIVYSRQARGYMLGVALCLAATVLLLRLLQPGERRRLPTAIAYGLTLALAGLTHYSTLPIALAHGFILLFRARSTGPWSWVVVAVLAAAAPIAIWILNGGLQGMEQMLAASTEHLGRLGLPPADRAHEACTLVAVIRGAGAQVLCLAGYPVPYTSLPTLLVAPLLLVPITLVLLAWRREKDQDRRRAAIALLLLALSTPAFAVAMAVAAGHTIPLISRYAVFSAPYACLLLAWAIDTLSQGARRPFGRAVHPLALIHACALAYFLPRMYGDVHRTGSFGIERTAAELNAIGALNITVRSELTHGNAGDALRTNLLLNDRWLDTEQRVRSDAERRLELHVVDGEERRLLRAW